VTEFEIARALDLPEPLPEDEQLLWMGSPSWSSVGRRVFHLRALAAYFGAILLLHGWWQLSTGLSPADAVRSVTALIPLGVAALAAFALLAWLTARSTVYAITDRRVLMRIGVALSITVTIPLRRVASADLRIHPDGTGDIALALAGTDRIAYLHLWPHARPWRIRDATPMLRSVTAVSEVADILRQALHAQVAGSGVAAPRVATPYANHDGPVPETAGASA
jgi:hypothetical protein